VYFIKNQKSSMSRFERELLAFQKGKDDPRSTKKAAVSSKRVDKHDMRQMGGRQRVWVMARRRRGCYVAQKGDQWGAGMNGHLAKGPKRPKRLCAEDPHIQGIEFNKWVGGGIRADVSLR